MLRNSYILLMLLLIIAGCNKSVTIQPAKTHIPKEYSANTAFALDSTLLNNSPQIVKSFYRENNYTTVWTNESNRKNLIDYINTIAPDGLQPENYNLQKLKEFESKNKTQQECVAYDILLSESFHKLAKHLFKGQIAAKSIYHDWDLETKTLDTKELLTQAVKHHAVTQTLDKCRPPHAVYAGLRKSFIQLNALPDDTEYPKIQYVDQIVVNDSNVIMPYIKKRLAYWKDLDAKDTSGAVYDRVTQTAVKKFQARHGIYADGKINSKTVEALNISKQKRLAQVIVNLERWKWFAYDFGEKAVIINIPNYWLAVVENNKDTVQMHKIIVGKPERRTPVLFSRFNFLVVNPTWTVPPTILKEDLVPSATKDRSYFASHNMKIFDWNKNEILPEDWDAEKPNDYYYVQGPGSYNALGEIKFNFNNSHTVYLHDTNSKQNFARAQRALSSGCVRVQNPFKLAGYLLQHEKGSWTKEKLEDLVALKETKNLQLKSNSYVHQLYWTAWLEKGAIQFRQDIYNLDDALYEKLRK